MGDYSEIQSDGNWGKGWERYLAFVVENDSGGC